MKKEGVITMELELFTVSIKEDKTVKVDFNRQLLQVITEEELLKGISDKMEGLLPIVESIVDFIRTKS